MAGSCSLSLISLTRLLGIVWPSSHLNNLTCRTVYLILVTIWVLAFGAAVPTELYRRYWVRYWADAVETNCDDSRDNTDSYALYWMLMMTFSVWIPSLIMISSFFGLNFKLKRSIKMFSYLSGDMKSCILIWTLAALIQ